MNLPIPPSTKIKDTWGKASSDNREISTTALTARNTLAETLLPTPLSFTGRRLD